METPRLAATTASPRLHTSPRRSPGARRQLAALAVAALTCLCCNHQGLAEPPKSSVRTITRPSSDPVVIDERHFEPILLGKDVPAELQEAYKAWASGRTHEARKAFGAFIAAHPTHQHTPRTRFLLAVLEDEAGRDDVAAQLYEATAHDYPLLSDYALYYGARSAYAAGLYEKSISLAAASPASSRFAARAAYLRGAALVKLGAHDQAIEALDGWVRKHDKHALLPEVKLDLAQAHEAAGHFERAGELFHQLRYRFPGTSVEEQAEAGVKRMRKKLSAKVAARVFRVTLDDRLMRASVLYDRHRSDQVVEEMTALLGEAGVKRGSKMWCDAIWLRGRAYTKLRKHSESAADYTAMLDGCKGDARTLQALFANGKALWNVDRDKDSLATFERVWTEFPTHSYADDAVLYAARIHRSNDAKAESERLLRFQIEHFPNGDMLSDAHWYLFVDLYGRGEYASAIAYVDGVGDQTGENDLYTRGRLAYFRARALEQLGQTDKAKDGFVKVANDVPMSYYALLALNRLKELDPTRFDREIDRLATDGKEDVVWTIDPPHVAKDSAFVRGVELLRLGLFQEAKGEFANLRERFPGKEDLLWILTLLFDRAGAYNLSHDIPRREIASFGTAYPVGKMHRMYELAYPRPFHDEVSSWANKRGLPEALVYAIMREESGFNPRIESWANACGLMQLMVPTAQDMARADDLKKPKPAKLNRNHLLEPETNVRLGTRYLQLLTEAYGKHLSVAIASYNGGQGNIDRWIKERGQMPFDLWVEEIPFGQTRGYTKRVTMSLWIYQWLYGAEAGTTDKPTAQARMIEIPLKLPAPSL